MASPPSSPPVDGDWLLLAAGLGGSGSSAGGEERRTLGTRRRSRTRYVPLPLVDADGGLEEAAEGAREEPGRVFRFACPVCHAEFARWTQLTEHRVQRRHAVTYCARCLFVAATRAQMTEHQQTMQHTGTVGTEVSATGCSARSVAEAPAPADPECRLCKPGVVHRTNQTWRGADERAAGTWWCTQEPQRTALAHAFRKELRKHATPPRVAAARRRAVEAANAILAVDARTRGALPVEAYGSTVIGTDTDASDVDLSFEGPAVNKDVDVFAEAANVDADVIVRARWVALLIDAADLLSNDERFSDVEAVVHSRVRVPLLRGTYVDGGEGGVRVHVSFTVGTRNVLKSHAAAAVVKRCPMLRDFVRLTKLWAAARGVNDPVGAGTLNSWCLLLLCYQHASSHASARDVIPPLDELFPCDGLPGRDAEAEGAYIRAIEDACASQWPGSSGDDDEGDEGDDCGANDVVDLFASFVNRHYLNIDQGFWADGLVVSALRGAALVRAMDDDCSFARWQGAALAVEDPFETEENAARTDGARPSGGVRGAGHTQRGREDRNLCEEPALPVREPARLDDVATHARRLAAVPAVRALLARLSLTRHAKR